MTEVRGQSTNRMMLIVDSLMGVTFEWGILGQVWGRPPISSRRLKRLPSHMLWAQSLAL